MCVVSLCCSNQMNALQHIAQPKYRSIHKFRVDIARERIHNHFYHIICTFEVCTLPPSAQTMIGLSVFYFLVKAVVGPKQNNWITHTHPHTHTLQTLSITYILSQKEDTRIMFERATCFAISVNPYPHYTPKYTQKHQHIFKKHIKQNRKKNIPIIYI